MKNSKIKRNLAGLLAVLQLGLVSGCSLNEISDEEYDEALEQIEQLEDDNRVLTDENKRLEDQNKALAEENQTLKDEINAKNENKPSAPTDEPDVTEVKLAEKDNIINAALLQEIGLDFDYSNIPEMQDVINYFNSFLSNYEAVTYSVSSNHIRLMADGICVATIYSQEDPKTVHFLTTYGDSLNHYYCTLYFNDDNSLSSIFVSDYLTWDTDEYIYSKEHAISPNLHVDESVGVAKKAVGNEEGAVEYDIQIAAVCYTTYNDYCLEFTNKLNHDERTRVLIQKEDYDLLKELISSYDATCGDFLPYIKDTLIVVIQKNGKEDELQFYVDIINAIGDEQNPVTDEVDNPKVDTSDVEVKPNPVTGHVEAVNAALLQEIGIDFDYSNIPAITSCIEFLNNFIATYSKAEYEIQKNNGMNRIEFRSDGAIIASAMYDSVNKVLSINLQYYSSHCYYCAVFDDNNELAYFDGRSGWNVDNMYCTQGYSEYPKADGNSSCYNYIDVSNYEDFTLNLHIEAYKVNSRYYLSLNDEADIGLKSINLNEEDYQALVNLFNSYDTNSGNILAYVKDTLIEVISKYDKEGELQSYINIINGTGARTLTNID